MEGAPLQVATLLLSFVMILDFFTMVEATIPIPAGLPTTFDNTWGAAMIGGFITAV